MFYCSKCGFWLKEDAKFCPQCGAPVTAPAPVNPAYTQSAEQPVAEPVASVAESVMPVVVAAPVVNAAPAVQTKDKVLGFVGMGLGIFGLVWAIFGILYTLIGMEEQGLGFAFSVVFGMLSMAPGIVGRCLCNQSMENGNLSTPCSVGSKISLAAIIVSCVMLFLGVINLIV